jgi:hypothetical protein
MWDCRLEYLAHSAFTVWRRIERWPAVGLVVRWYPSLKWSLNTCCCARVPVAEKAGVGALGGRWRRSWRRCSARWRTVISRAWCSATSSQTTFCLTARVKTACLRPSTWACRAASRRGRRCGARRERRSSWRPR